MTQCEFKAIRQTLKLTQTQMAVELGCHPNTVGRMESGSLPIVDAKAKAVMNLWLLKVTVQGGRLP